MKRTPTVLLLGLVFSFLLGISLMGIQPTYARLEPTRAPASVDCETARFNAVMNADTQYTNTFRSWRYGVPVSCMAECTATCGSSNPSCMSGCLTSCDDTRFDAFTTAQGVLGAAGNQPCAYNPDQCDDARARRDACQATLNGQWETPDYDANGNIDITWRMYVSAQYMSCYAGTGMDSCE
jgi:hypothetical protein